MWKVKGWDKQFDNWKAMIENRIIIANTKLLWSPMITPKFYLNSALDLPVDSKPMKEAKKDTFSELPPQFRKKSIR